ncbi:fasciclin domain-containing protein [Kamptonema formosum]|uniref:fasciclin domain-containing protein n=1 Tax=Kamptonema formosum TaxID=331992 RepID=UPI00034C62B6|nr:fasciclin domain-containing protein [Oscillatoria sp. PCC 10802]
MKTQNRPNRFKMLAGLVGAAGASLLIGLPALGQYYYPYSLFNPSSRPLLESSDEEPSVVELVTANNSLKTLARALQVAGLTDTLAGKGNFTILAPTDRAFEALPPGAVEELLKPQNKEKLLKILNYHVIAGKVSESDFQKGEVKTVEGNSVKITVDQPGNQIKFNQATLNPPSIPATNGVIIVIDKVLIPPDSIGLQESSVW